MIPTPIWQDFPAPADITERDMLDAICDGEHRQGVRAEDLTLIRLACQTSADEYAIVNARGIGGEPLVYRVVIPWIDRMRFLTERGFVEHVIGKLREGLDEIVAELVRRTPHAPGLLDRFRVRESH